MNVLLLINARSGHKNSKIQLLSVVDILCAHAYDVKVYVTQRQRDAYDYLLKNQGNFDIVCVFGGDGTMNEVTNALMHMEKKPKLGYFPSGTMNDFGSNFELGSDLAKITERICEGNERPFDVGQCNDIYFNYVAAFGAMCDVPFSTTRESKELLGNIAYIIEGISRLPEVTSHALTYTVDGKENQCDILFGLIYSGNRVAGMEIDDKDEATIDDGLFNVLLVEYVPTFFNAPDVFTILMQSDRFIHRFKTDQISLRFEDDLPMTLDGEKFEANGHCDIIMHEKALKLLA